MQISYSMPLDKLAEFMGPHTTMGEAYLYRLHLCSQMWPTDTDQIGPTKDASIAQALRNFAKSLSEAQRVEIASTVSDYSIAPRASDCYLAWAFITGEPHERARIVDALPYLFARYATDEQRRAYQPKG